MERMYLQDKHSTNLMEKKRNNLSVFTLELLRFFFLH